MQDTDSLETTRRWLGEHFYRIQNNNMELMQKVSPTFSLKADQQSIGASHMKLTAEAEHKHTNILQTLIKYCL
jgi:hypothetical protein